ncbi:Uu.00g127010.m01.CDS01 [Anthostomella pinea]|uniref:Uu.00g127010.m01.CDS01 n=1 Tax=Anthostomella pinea TaxID=933095 RepID=A0AAI8VI36_9PEZI|nr:Uu.00g127010.m01.CDS01 [Anthostomella pinea]
MPQDPDLYGQRPAKKQKKEIPLSSSLAFASHLTSLLSAPTSSSSSPGASASSGRARPSKTKDDIFSVKAKKKRKHTSKDDDDKEASNDKSGSSKIRIRDVRGTEDEKQDFARARRRMEEKARLYAAMKRGDYIAKNNEAAPLVDFDRKWAEKNPEEGDGGGDGDPTQRHSSSGNDNESSDGGGGGGGGGGAGAAGAEMIEYKDEYGRTRQGTRAEVSRLQRRDARIALGAAELERMAARPHAAPQNLIYGDAIQAAAFNPESTTWDQMATLAAKRDKSPTPPADTHFDGGAEIRTKGVGFYQFSRDKDDRKAQMEELERERGNTEHVRLDREAEREKRKREIEERRRTIGRKRAEKMADTFLDGLAGEMRTPGATGEKEGLEEGEKKASSSS